MQIFVPFDIVHSSAHFQGRELHVPPYHDGIHIGPRFDHVRGAAHVQFLEERSWFAVISDGCEVICDAKHSALFQHSGIRSDDERTLEARILKKCRCGIGGTYHHAQLLFLTSIAEVHPLAFQLLHKLRPRLVGVVGHKHHPLLKSQEVVHGGHRSLGVFIADTPNDTITVEDVGLKAGKLFKRGFFAGRKDVRLCVGHFGRPSRNRTRNKVAASCGIALPPIH
mmetsp:Transcript_45370/g.98773  ORF Transcript_45370/g.98773 Transcript_45370/m.98773 type:complete len:224 (-) Transcript_45370:16-687(-)